MAQCKRFKFNLDDETSYKINTNNLNCPKCRIETL